MLKQKHSFSLKQHRHTSYAGLVFVLLVAGMMLLGVSVSALAAPPAVNPQYGSVGLTGVVKGPPPSVASVILSPSDGSSTTAIPITVSGTCPSGTFVTITKNNAFAGATSCQSDGTFSLLVDLFDGSNTLIAQETDALGQAGPNSNPVTVTYNAPNIGLNSATAGKQLFLTTGTSVTAADQGSTVTETIAIVGGVPPVAVNFDWGDGTSTLISQPADGNVQAAHTYARPGTYNIIVRATDALGNAAYMQLVAVINGPTAALGSTKGTGIGSIPGDLVTAWPLYILAFLMVIFFWLGERREVWKLRRRHLLMR